MPSVEPSLRGDHGVVEVRALFHDREAFPVGLAIHEFQRIAGSQVGIVPRVFAFIQQKPEAGKRVDAAVIAALWADVPVRLPVFLPDDLAAPLALLPQTL